MISPGHVNASRKSEVAGGQQSHPQRHSNTSTGHVVAHIVHNSEADDSNFFEFNNKMLPKSKNRIKRQTAVRIVERKSISRKLGRRRPYYVSRPAPIAKRRRFPKQPPPPPHQKLIKRPPNKHPANPNFQPPPALPYGPPVGYFLMNHNNEIVHKAKDLAGIPPKYLDKIIPPNFIKDAPSQIYALEHEGPEVGPPLGAGESKEVYPNVPSHYPTSYLPTDSYGAPIQPQHFIPTSGLNYGPPPGFSSPHSANSNRGQSETQHNVAAQQFPEPPAPVLHQVKPKSKKKKKIKQQFSLQPDSYKNSYDAPISSYDAPLNYVPADSVQSYVHQKPRPVYSVGQSYVESYGAPHLETSQSEESAQPQLPAQYDQNEFKTINKSNNKKKVVYHVKTSHEDEEEDHGLALEYPTVSEEATPPSSFMFGNRNRSKPKKRPHKYDYIDSYEDPSISNEMFLPTTPRVTTTTTKKTHLRNDHHRTKTGDKLSQLLDTEALRTAYQSGRNSYKIEAAKKAREKTQEQHNFVLLSSANPHPYTYRPHYGTTPSFSGEDYHITSIEKSKSQDIYTSRSSAESDEDDYETSLEAATQNDYGLRKRNFSSKKRNSWSKADITRSSDMASDKSKANNKFILNGYVPATTMNPASRFNPEVQFTKTFSSKIEQPRQGQQKSPLWKGQQVPGNHKVTQRDVV